MTAADTKKDPHRQATNHAARVLGDDQPQEDQPMPAYPATVTDEATDAAHAALLHELADQVQYVAIDQSQCEHCALVARYTEARVYGSDRGHDGLYAECCLRCAVGLVRYFREQGDGDVLVELGSR